MDESCQHSDRYQTHSLAVAANNKDDCSQNICKLPGVLVNGKEMNKSKSNEIYILATQQTVSTAAVLFIILQTKPHLIVLGLYFIEDLGPFLIQGNC